MSLLKRIGTTAPIQGNGGQPGMNTGVLGTNPGTQNTNMLSSPTGRLGSPGDGPKRPGLTNNSDFVDLKNRVQQKLIAELDPKLDLTKTEEVRRNVEEIFNEILDAESIILTRVDRARLFEA